MEAKKKKVILGMSGGVDSSVAASLLQKSGFEVVGVFLEFWKTDNSNFDDAKKVADLLGITLHKVDAKDEFKKKIVDHFISEYKSGRTPNPCVLCNPNMKFRILLNKMFELEGDFVATGHYAKIQEGRLFQAKDKRKDQSYFLYGLEKRQLEKILFPLGDHTKDEIRKIALDLNLPVAQKSESQDICFVLGKDFGDFLKKYIKSEEGEILDTHEKVLGKHTGLPFYTIGQRKGINLGGDGPYYVVEKNISKNELIVTNDPEDSRLTKDEMIVREINWINENLSFPLKKEVKIRYQSDPICATIEPIEDNLKKCRVKFDTPQKLVTPGQSAVFCDGHEVLGGGIID